MTGQNIFKQNFTLKFCLKTHEICHKHIKFVDHMMLIDNDTYVYSVSTIWDQIYMAMLLS